MDPRTLRIADFTYDLPQERISQHPLTARDGSKLLVFRDGSISDQGFASLADHLPQGSLLVLNDTRVVKARVLFQRTSGAVIECMVLEPEDALPMEAALNARGHSRWRCMVGNAKRWKGEDLVRGEGMDTLRMHRVDDRDGEHLVEFTWDSDRTFAEMLAIHGSVPLPPYMKRDAEEADSARYNTVFAEHDGSVAAPTASLHFTTSLLDALARKNVKQARVTLHVGAGTFLPVKSDTMNGHGMHGEQIRVSRSTVEALIAAIDHAPIVPIGTTALRTIESLYWFGADLCADPHLPSLHTDQWRPYANDADVPPRRALEAVLAWMDARKRTEVAGSTHLLIAPGYRFRLADALVTNFHQPGSTLLLLVAAFIGEDWRKVYAHAMANGYRFLSYGDGSLLWRKGPINSNVDPLG